MATLSEQAGALIREARKSKGLTQKELAALLGIDETRVSKYESGKQNPTIETLEKIANALNVTIELTLK